MKINKPSCGLCGKTKNLIQTSCCNNWVCDDAREYVLFSYAANSCYRNHDRYTICATHHREDHSGKWQDCQKCKEEYPLENYVDFATNDCNFEKLSNPPKVVINCVSCGFESSSVRDFSYQTSKGWYCCKEECEKSAVNI